MKFRQRTRRDRDGRRRTISKHWAFGTESKRNAKERAANDRSQTVDFRSKFI